MPIEGIPKEMVAVQVVEFHKPYEIRKVPTPSELKPYEILLKTVAASLCHTDSKVIEGKFPTKLPCTASHEGTGIVRAIGSKVTNFRIGDRVMSGVTMDPCGECYNCQGPDDWHQYCTNNDGHIGTFIDGAFAEYHVVDSRSSCHVPDTLSLASAAPLACAGCTIYRAIIVSEVQEGEFLALVGAGGGLGHLGIQFALAKGINVVAVDARDEGLEMCHKAGAAHVFDAREGTETLVNKVQAVTGGLGVHASINVSEHPTSATTACAITRLHGTMVQVAVGPEKVYIDSHQFLFRDIRIRGSLHGGQKCNQQMLEDAAKYNIKVENNLFYGLDEVSKLVQLANSGKMKGKAVCIVDKDELDKESASL